MTIFNPIFLTAPTKNCCTPGPIFCAPVFQNLDTPAMHRASDTISISNGLVWLKSLTFQLPVMPIGIHLVLACPATIISMYYIGTGNNGSKDILFEAEFVYISFFLTCTHIHMSEHK